MKPGSTGDPPVPAGDSPDAMAANDDWSMIETILTAVVGVALWLAVLLGWP